ncbi:hypothetical protein [Nocardia sp. XZ_19_369]|uniref:hypothetical protein n=1 Tax=Nocardia sp. XZ_19_369 TaxID=2769487 RepID=UPI00188EA695|nr:hypothetical protein [Nocardia sp. XZ_19_369]
MDQSNTPGIPGTGVHLPASPAAISTPVPRNNLVLLATLSLGLTLPALFFAGVLIVLGAVDPKLGAAITVALVAAVNAVVLSFFRGRTNSRRLRKALACLIYPERFDVP